MVESRGEFIKLDDGSVINTNNSEYERYKMAREKAHRDKQLASKVEKLEQEMSDIKNLLISISNRIS
jgi:hypothetical protein